LLRGAAAAWPLAARAQQPALPVVSFVSGWSPDEAPRTATPFRNSLNAAGYIDGQNVTVEYHGLAGRYEGLSSVMADLVRRRVSVIATPGNTPSAATGD
jgi:putative ABC transport system substrate-binding protein